MDRNYPQNTIRVIDDSGAVVLPSLLQETSHRPMVFIQAAKGKPFVPYRCSGPEARKYFGDETWDMFGPWYNNEHFFCENAFFRYHAADLVRLVAPDAKKSSLVLEAHVAAADVVQYERDADGGIILDADGKPIPLMDAGQIVTAPGYKISHKARVLTDDESFDKLLIQTVQVSVDETITIYPLIGLVADSEGAYADLTGFKLSYDFQEQDNVLLTSFKALSYIFEPIQHIAGSSIPVAVRTNNNGTSSTFFIKPDLTDERVAMRVSVDDVLNSNYGYTESGQRLSKLPYEIKFYSDNWKQIGDLIAALELTETDFIDADGFMANILTGKNTRGQAYHYVEIDNSADTVIYSTNSINYMLGGSDGDTSRDTFEELIVLYLKGELYPQIVDQYRYPITHIYDVGYKLQTKYAFADFLALREEVKIEMATHDGRDDYLSEEEDMSIGIAIASRMLTVPESLFDGTPCCRGSVYGQAGKSVNEAYVRVLPTTFWAARRRSETQGGMMIRRTMGGRPTSEVGDLFSELSYYEYIASSKTKKFANGINYIQFANRVALFFPDHRSVYADTTSVLASGTYTDCLIHTKYHTNWAWSMYSGREEPSERMYDLIAKEITSQNYDRFGSLYTTEVIVDQTADMINTGDEIRAIVDLWGNAQFRFLRTFIHAKRPGVSTATDPNA